MLFNSYPFLLVYLPIVLIGFFSLARLFQPMVAKSWLFLSSLFFYAFWDVRFLPLLLGSILFNCLMGRALLSMGENSYKQPVRKGILVSGIAANLALLFYFKYFNFFITVFAGDAFRLANLVLPIGISFFTFTQIAYLVDAFHYQAQKCDPVSYGLFVTVFPHLIAGPILHHKEMIQQFESDAMYRLNWSNIAQGLFLFLIGLFKKIVIADPLSELLQPIFAESYQHVPFIQAWVGALAYTLQLYFDFSGYSDMAVGLGLFFNLHLPINFNSPYKADSIIDFWRRWHITLSHFLRDYLYIPLGGNRGGKWSKLRNLFLTMFLGGIWHGAGWTFLLWGACHGSFLIINHLWRETGISLPKWFCKCLTLLAVIIAWVIFRSPTVDKAVDLLQGMVGWNGVVLPESYAVKLSFLQPFGVVFSHIYEARYRFFDLLWIFFLFLVALFAPNSQEWLNRFKQRPLVWTVPCAFIFVFMLLRFDNLTEFLYYQF